MTRCTRLLAARSMAMVFSAAVVFGWGGFPAPTVSHARLVAQPDASRYGLRRAWFTQIELDSSRARLKHVTIHGGALFVVTSQGIVHAVDAETGGTLWVQAFGRPEFSTFEVGANDEHVAVISGSSLYALRRSDGRTLFQHRVNGIPAAGPTVTAKRVYVPMLKGPVESYALPSSEDSSKEAGRARKSPEEPWHHHSGGRTAAPLLFTGQAVSWSTNRGYVYVADADSQRVPLRVEVSHGFSAPPVSSASRIFAASLGGYVYAIQRDTGRVVWRLTVGEPVTASPAVVNDRLFVCPERHGMFCLAADRGEELWWNPRAAQFVAASPTRVYAADSRGQLLILDATNGSRLAMLPLVESSIPLLNQQTDRIYLASDTGLIQCLHETALAQPIRYDEPEKAVSDESKPMPRATEEPKDEPRSAEAADKAPEKNLAAPQAEAEAPAAEAEESAPDEDEKDPFEP